MINFYTKYLPGSIFVNNVANSIADAFGGIAAIACFRGVSIEKGFLVAFSLCTASSFTVAFAEMIRPEAGPVSNKERLANFIVPLGVLGAKFGVSAAYTY